ncbi:MAG: 2Fe-2S iron-sulfur cluster-binding protein, partial [Anaerolineales bacterium]
MVNITLNGKQIQASEGKTILQVAQENQVSIPTLCYHKDLSPTGNCRMCVVEVKNSRFLQAACVTQIYEGIEINTNTLEVERSRRLSLQ